MKECHVVRESERSLERDGREFVIRYSFGTRQTGEGQQCCIEASLCERTETGAGTRTGCSVEMQHVHPDMVRGIFEMIAGAEDPVFPVHVPEIVRDQLAAAAMVAVRTCA